MNLRIDLILEEEQRSGSIVSGKSLFRVVAMILPFVLLTVVAMEFVEMMKLKGALSELETKWAVAEPKVTAARTIREQAAVNGLIQEELDTWSTAHINWHEQLAALVKVVPGYVQIDKLKITHAFQLLADQTSARVYTLVIDGKAIGARAEQHVQRLREAMQSEPPFRDLTATVTVAKYGKDTTEGADKFDRIFQIQCTYEPRKFE